MSTKSRSSAATTNTSSNLAVQDTAAPTVVGDHSGITINYSDLDAIESAFKAVQNVTDEAFDFSSVSVKEASGVLDRVARGQSDLVTTLARENATVVDKSLDVLRKVNADSLENVGRATSTALTFAHDVSRSDDTAIIKTVAPWAALSFLALSMVR